jgi:hypothetical protein
MKGFIAKTAAAVFVTGGLAAGGGCVSFRDLYDTCWPERYNYAAKKEVCETFSPQVHNGRIIDQTIWDYYFEPNSEKLTPEGREHLKWILQRRPWPDTTIYLATANELGVSALGAGVPPIPAALVYDRDNPEKFAERRYELDMLRQQEIRKYLAAQTGGRADCFNIVVHNPSEIPPHGLRAVPVENTIVGGNGWYAQFAGTTAVPIGGGAATGVATLPGGR